MDVVSSTVISIPQFCLTRSTYHRYADIHDNRHPPHITQLNQECHFFWTQTLCSEIVMNLKCMCKPSSLQQTHKYIIIITGQLYPCSPYDLIVIATFSAVCWRSSIHQLSVSTASCQHHQQRKCKVNMDFMQIMSMLKKVTPAKSGTASETCH